VHREAVEDYTAIRAELLELIERTAARITGGHAGWINPTPFAHHGVVIDDGAADPGRVQVLADGTGAAWLDTDAWTVSAAPATALPDGTPPVVVRRDGTRIELSNGLVRAAIDEHGHLVSFIDDTTGREFVAVGESAGVLQLHPDLPNVYDAWDVEDFDLRRFTVIDAVDAVDVTDDGPLVARVVVGRTFGPSSVTQTIELRAGSPRLNVHVEADWHHQERLLKVAFPFDVQTDEITREIQFGNLTTPIHRNTSWDDARFEFCAHRWVHVHETGAGIALLNDSKYGHDALRTRSQLDDGSEVPTTTVRLSLLRGAKYPDPVQDQGHHEFTYSLLPTAGRLDDGRIVQEGYQLNQPVRRLAANADTAADTPVASSTVVTSDRPTVVVETVKPADDGSGEVIIRCYEAAGGRADATLRLGVPASSVRIVDARERPLPGHDWLPVSDGQVPVTLRPFQIQTLAVRR
jgi:alpha-mannosidase